MEKVSMNFEGKNLTGNSRLIPIAQFAEKLKVEDTLRSELSIKSKHNSKYSIRNSSISTTTFGTSVLVGRRVVLL